MKKNIEVNTDKRNEENIKVSVLCMAYNHEAYIEKALEGFINQKTNFGYEVLIHDDASSDRTVSIIRQYQDRYPNIIKPIFQKENQYSKGVKITRDILTPQAKGKYLAFCEGDDYWTDKNKLQVQFDYMEAHPEYAICVHQSTQYDCVHKCSRTLSRFNEDCDVSVNDIIRMGGGCFATNSVFMRKEVYTEMPDCFNAKGFGDYQLFMYGAIKGKCHFMKKNMSVYNYGTVGSWTDRIYKNTEKRIKHLQELIRMLKCVDEYYSGLYSADIIYAISEAEYALHRLQGNFIKILNKKYKVFYMRSRKNGEFPFKECVAVRHPLLFQIKNKVLNNKK